VRKFIIFIAFILLLLNSYIYLNNNTAEVLEVNKLNTLEEHQISKSIIYNFGKYVTVKKNTNLYKKNNNEYIKIGTIKKGTYLNLENSINTIKTKYLKLEDTDYYISIKDIQKTEKTINEDYSKYVLKYELVTKPTITIRNNTGEISINDTLNIKVLKYDTDYYFSFNNQIFRISKDQVKTKKANSNEVATSIPVLNYHFFYHDEYGNYCNEIICLSKSKLEEQFKYLHDNGYVTLTIQQFNDWYDGKIEVPEKSVLLTIDDGGMGTSISDGNVLIPLLEKYEINATLFLITAWWSKDDYKSDYLDVESHGFDIHKQGSCGDKRLVCLDKEQLKNDLQLSINLLESNKAFCYPFYRYTTDSIEVIEELGFSTAFIGGSRNATRYDNRYLIPRYPIVDGITIDEFIYMVK